MTPPGATRYTLAVDFDGVIHAYTSPWAGHDVIPDPPVEGAIEWLDGMMDEFDVVIHTTRGKTAAGADAVLRWLLEHGLEIGDRALTVSAEKPPALMYLDDRGRRFEGPGTFPTAEEVHRALPWNKGGRRSPPLCGRGWCARELVNGRCPEHGEEIREPERALLAPVTLDNVQRTWSEAREATP